MIRVGERDPGRASGILAGGQGREGGCGAGGLGRAGMELGIG